MPGNDPTIKDLFYIKDATNNVIYQIKAISLKDAITIALTGNVTGSASTTLGSNVTIDATIANGAVTESKLATDAVTNGKIKDGEITKAKFNANVYNEVDGTIADGTNANLATKTQVKAYVESVISSEGHYKGVQSVATINTWTAANLHNGDRVITSSNPEGSGTGTLTLGNLPVVDGQEVIFYVSDDQSVKIWQSSEGNYKIKQTAIPGNQGSTTKTLTGIAQNTNGEISPTFENIQDASTSQKGLVQLAGSIGATVSTENNHAASEKAVRDAINALDVSSVGGNGKFISAISESDGKISATPKTMDSTPTAGHTDTTVTSDGIKTALDNISTAATSDAEVTAAALDDLDARMRVVEEAVNSDNIGDKVADSFDAQVLKAGGEDVAEALASKVKSVKIGSSSATELKDSDGNVVIPLAVPTGATGAKDGAMSAADKKALDDLKSGAVTNVEYVANATGGGGSLKKTINGTQSVIMNFMTTAEALQLWADAKAAALAT